MHGCIALACQRGRCMRFCTIVITEVAASALGMRQSIYKLYFVSNPPPQVGLASITASVQRAGGSKQHPAALLDARCVAQRACV